MRFQVVRLYRIKQGTGTFKGMQILPKSWKPWAHYLASLGNRDATSVVKIIGNNCNQSCHEPWGNYFFFCQKGFHSEYWIGPWRMLLFLTAGKEQIKRRVRMKSGGEPFLVGLRCLGIILQSQRLLLWFPVRAPAWVACWGMYKGNQSTLFSHVGVYLPFSLPPHLSKNK